MSDSRPVFKCTRCNHVFSSGERSPARGTRAAENRNLPLPFGGRRGPGRAAETAPAREDLPPLRRPTAPEEGVPDDEPVLETPPEPIREDPDEETVETTGAHEPAFVAGDDSGERGPEEDETLRDDDEPAEDEPPLPRRGRARRSRPVASTQDDDMAIEEDDGPLLIRENERRESTDRVRSAGRPAREARSPMRPVLAGVGLVLASFLGLTALLRRNPEMAVERLVEVPLLGRLVGDDRHVLARLQVSGLESSVEKIKGDRSALVVSGRVTNTTGQPLRLVEVEGRLLADGVERRRQVVYAANQMRKTIRDLSASEVEMLLRLEPNRRFVIRPGESATFLLVFPDPPANASEVDCRIVDARAA